MFCSIIEAKAPASLVYEDGACAAFLDIQPINPGHTLVIPKLHAPSLKDLPAEALAHVTGVARQVAEAIRRSNLGATGINLFLSDGESAGQEVFHVHLHVVPRFEGDGISLRLPEGHPGRPSRKELDSIAANLRAALDNE